MRPAAHAPDGASTAAHGGRGAVVPQPVTPRLTTSPDDDGVLHVHGELDATTVPGVASQAEACLRSGRPCRLDLTGVTFIDSVGMSTLIQLHRRAEELGSHFAIVGRSRYLENRFSVFGLEDHFSSR